MATLSGKRRRNLAESTSEYWRPPALSPGVTRLQRLSAALRRFFDLQAGSVWNDLRVVLPAASGTLLDVGCGAQPYRSLLPAHTRYIAIDISHAADHFGYETPGTRYFSGDRWPVEDESVDFVLCSEVMEHVLDPRLFLSEAYRCLKPQGKMLITVPFAARWHFVPFDYWRYTPAALKHLLAQAQFGEIVIQARGNPLTVACYKVMALLLPLLFPQNPRLLHKWAYRIFGVAAFPATVALAAVAHLTMETDWGNDCLGYTILARRHPRADDDAPLSEHG
jgi:SAM-dependent methyltransferase